MPVTRRWLLGLATGAALLLGGLAAPPASADCGSQGWLGGGGIGAGAGSCTPGGPQPSDPDPTGGGPKGGSTTVTPPNPCRYFFWMTGPDMATYAANFHPPLIAPAPGWEAHATDTAGAWYEAHCVYGAGDGTPDAFDARSAAFKAANPPAWFGAPPPPPPIPVADLVEYAKDSTGIPLSVVSVNPTGETVVGLRTWVWPTAGLPEPVVARAESGPNWAQVTATPGKLQLSAPGATVGSCDRAPAYTPGAPDSATDCYVEFRSSSARTGTSQIRVTIVWRVVLTTSDGRNEVLDAAFPRASTTDIAVAEVQSVLR